MNHFVCLSIKIRVQLHKGTRSPTGLGLIFEALMVCLQELPLIARQVEKAANSEAAQNIRRLFGEYDFSDKKLTDFLGILPLKSVA